MRTIESFVVAPEMQDRRVKTLAAQEFQTTILGMLGHDLRQSLQVIQGTYALLRSRLEQMPQQAWLDRGERAATKLTEQLNCLVDAFYLAGHGSRTSISGAILFAMPLFEEDPYRGLRRVIDISGDGPNNNGPPVTPVRDEALGKGIVINGLPIMVKEPSYATMDIDNLDWYYEDCVIGGSGSFVVPITDRERFKEAIRTKLLLEVAARTPEHRVVPTAEKAPRVSCTIGEKIWQDRWGR